MKLNFYKIPIIKVESGRDDDDTGSSDTELHYCDLPVLRKYHSALKSGYSLKEDIRGKMLGDLYLDRVIAVNGAFGVVMRGYDVLDGKFYAVKIIIPKKTSLADVKSEMEAFEILSKHPKCDEDIVCLYKAGFYRGSDKLPEKVREAFREAPHTKNKKMVKAKGNYGYLQIELMSADLKDFIKQMRKYQGEDWGQKYPEIVESLMRDILSGMYVVHEVGLAHMDLKPDNILVKFRKGIKGCEFYENPKAEDIEAKVSDLGFICSGAKERGQIQRCWARTDPNYAAPETARNWRWDEYPIEMAQKSDIWGLGLILGDLMFEKKFMRRIRLANDLNVERIEYIIGKEDELTEEEVEKLKEKAYRKFEDNYYTFIEKTPDYDSGNEDFDRDVSILFHRMIDVDPDRRDDIEDLIAMFPSL